MENCCQRCQGSLWNIDTNRKNWRMYNSWRSMSSCTSLLWNQVSTEKYLSQIPCLWSLWCLLSIFYWNLQASICLRLLQWPICWKSLKNPWKFRLQSGKDFAHLKWMFKLCKCCTCFVKTFTYLKVFTLLWKVDKIE